MPSPLPQITTLSSGLRVASMHMPRLESVAFGVWVDAGAGNEAEANNGVAHFLEHMAFKGTKKRNALQIAETFDAIGGNLNAYTSMEHTVYYAKTLARDLPLAVEVMADILLHSTFDPKEMERERQVILQEIAMHHDTPDDRVFDYFHAAAYPDQPMGRSILGTEARVGNFKREDLTDFMGAHYAAERMMVVAAGKVEHEALAELATKNFGDIRTSAGAGKPKTEYKGGSSLVEDDLEQVHLAMGFPGVGYHHKDFYPLQLLATVLGGGMSSRLFQEVREKRGLAYSISAFNTSYADTGVFTVYSSTGEKESEELVKVACGELARAQNDITEDELVRAKNQITAGLLMSRESAGSEFETIGRHIFCHGRYLPLEEVIAKVEAVRLEDLRLAAGSLFTRGKPTFAALGPVGKLPGELAV